MSCVARRYKDNKYIHFQLIHMRKNNPKGEDQHLFNRVICGVKLDNAAMINVNAVYAGIQSMNRRMPPALVIFSNYWSDKSCNGRQAHGGLSNSLASLVPRNNDGMIDDCVIYRPKFTQGVDQPRLVIDVRKI